MANPTVRMTKRSHVVLHEVAKKSGRSVLDVLEESGLSTAAFAASEGFDPQRLYFWKRRLERTDTDTPTTTFVEVRQSTAATHIEVA